MHATDIETQFNPRKAVANVDEHAARFARLSTATRARRKALLDLRYGESPLATLDVFPAEVPDAPLHVFLHGGYWRGRDKSDYSYIADALVPLGITTVVMNYDLCPQVELPFIVEEAHAGLAWVHAHAREWGADPSRYTASGHSAGAHLIAAALARHGQEKVRPVQMPSAALLISGVYELEPVLSISVNQEIRLRLEQVAPMSPMRHAPCVPVRLTVAVGGAETQGFIGQSEAFARHCAAHGADATFVNLAGRDHYTVMHLLEAPEGELAQRVARDLAPR